MYPDKRKKRDGDSSFAIREHKKRGLETDETLRQNK